MNTQKKIALDVSALRVTTFQASEKAPVVNQVVHPGDSDYITCLAMTDCSPHCV